MANVIGVRFQNAGKLYFFDPGAFWPTPGDFVIVETARGVEFGEVVTGVREIADEQLTTELKKVVRVATAEDAQHARDNKAGEKEAYAICQKKIVEHKLDMKLVSVEYTFDNSKILFYFTANGRVDFRSLVKDLASIFKTRIELRQIGVRDEAKMLGGLGPCGRPICCGSFLGDFQPVSIKMAKEQNLSLNPNKISGVCGRLMCCLKYEQDNYEQIRKRMPKVGKEVVTPDGNGVVWELNIIKETVRVRIQKGDSSELRDYPMDDVQRVGQPPARNERPAVEERVEAAVEAAAEDVVKSAEASVEQPAKPEKAEKPEKPEKPQRPHRGEQSRSARERQHHREKREDGERREQPEKAEKGERSERREKGERSGRSARRDHGRNRHGSEQPVREGAEHEKPAVSRQEKPAPRPAAKQEPAPAPQKESAPAASPWKAAVERALREAQGDANEK